VQRADYAWIVLAIVVGAIAGFVWPQLAPLGTELARGFVRVMLICISPFIFLQIVRVFSSLLQAAQVRATLPAFIAMVIALSCVAVALGLIGVQLVAGDASSLPLARDASGASVLNGELRLGQITDLLVPSSLVGALAGNNVLHVVVIGVLVGLALRASQWDLGTLNTIIDRAIDVLATMIAILMRLAPIGIAGATLALVTVADTGLLLGLLQFVGYTVGVLLVLFAIPIVAVLGSQRLRAGNTIKNILQPLVVGGVTASSAAILPALMERLQASGISKPVVSVYVPLSAAFMLVGSTFFIGATASFACKLAGVDLTVSSGSLLGLMLVVGSKAIATVPRGSFAILAAILEAFGIPSAIVVAVIGILIAIDPLLDMLRTATNILWYALIAIAMDGIAGGRNGADAVRV
jgi:Na+/H+-dicarboxylate symporter